MTFIEVVVESRQKKHSISAIILLEDDNHKSPFDKSDWGVKNIQVRDSIRSLLTGLNCKYLNYRVITAQDFINNFQKSSNVDRKFTYIIRGHPFYRTNEPDNNIISLFISNNI